MLEFIESERSLLQQWSMRADSDLGILDAKALKKRITATIPYNRNLYRYNQVRSYFAQVETVMEQLCELAEQLPADDTLKLLDYALQRITRALETIDDSGGFRFGAVELLQATHINTCNRLDWPEEKLTNYLLDIVFSECYDFYPEIPSSYAEALGDSGMSIFNQTLQAGDYEAVEKWLAKCRKSSEQDYRLGTERIQASLFRAKEMWPEALEQQWLIYTKSLGLDDYRALLELAECAGDKRDWRKKSIQFLQEQSRSTARRQWGYSWADKLLEIHLNDEAFEEALAIATEEEINPDLLLVLARKISNQPEQAFPLFQRVIESNIMQTNNHAYRYAINLLQELAGIMQSSQQKQQMMELIEHLRQQYRAKRNFIKWLNEAF